MRPCGYSTKRPRRSCERRILSNMTDNSGRSPRPRTGRERIRTLTQAALNADVTVEQVDAVLGDLSDALSDLNNSTSGLDATLARFNETITRIDELAPRLIGVVERLEVIVDRVEKIVGLGEQVMAPWTATENAVRGAVNAVRKTTGL
jgi:ABC-type transporter Mla subunit MlaD